MSDIRQSPLWTSYLEKIGWRIDKINGNFVYIKKFPFIGSFIKIQRIKNLNFKNLEKLRKKYRAFSIKIEPDISAPKNFIDSLLKSGFKKNNFPLSPPKTILVDISKSKNKLLSEMHNKTRYNIGLAQRKEVRVKKSEDIEFFAKNWAKNQKALSFLSRKEIKTFWKVFAPKNAFILFAHHKNTILAGVLIGLWQKRAYYMYAFSTKEGKKLFAPTLLVWEMLLESKNRGIEIFDFEGIYDQRHHSATKSWQGFTRFKKSFGGKENEYPGIFSG